ncbi:MAG: hypothetical protein H0X28_04080 [Solirubrobacterales bacterium]|nr:hypothetical protein [Solirubrobacterales bacterium]
MARPRELLAGEDAEHAGGTCGHRCAGQVFEGLPGDVAPGERRERFGDARVGLGSGEVEFEALGGDELGDRPRRGALCRGGRAEAGAQRGCMTDLCSAHCRGGRARRR